MRVRSDGRKPDLREQPLLEAEVFLGRALAKSRDQVASDVFRLCCGQIEDSCVLLNIANDHHHAADAAQCNR